MTAAHGVSVRDEMWAHPDLLPTADDLEDPLGFAQRVGEDPMAELGLDGVVDEVAVVDSSADPTSEDSPESTPEASEPGADAEKPDGDAASGNGDR